MIRDFLVQFTDETLSYLEERNRYFFVPEDVATMATRIDDTPYSLGMFLGGGKNKKFLPSLALLQWLSRRTAKMAVVDEKAAWLFICGKDVFLKGILKSTVEDGVVLVYNTKEEVLGYGSMGKKGIKNRAHIGEYLHESP